MGNSAKTPNVEQPREEFQHLCAEEKKNKIKPKPNSKEFFHIMKWDRIGIAVRRN